MSGKAIRETVGFGAVVAGLVFVGLEIQQNNKLAQAAAYQAIGRPGSKQVSRPRARGWPFRALSDPRSRPARRT